MLLHALTELRCPGAPAAGQPQREATRGWFGRRPLVGLVVICLLGGCDEQPSPRGGGDLALPDGPLSREVGPPGDGPANDTAAGDDGGSYTTLPFEGGASYYAQWQNGPPSTSSFFPVAVWLQSPGNAAAYKAIGINLFVGLWQGPTSAQIADLAQEGLLTFCDQDSAFVAEPTIRAWTHDDEPDNAQPDGNGGWLPCVPTATIVSKYQNIVGKDSSRPVYLNFGQGVSYESWVGRGTCTGKLEMYPDYIKGADIISFDIYPVNSTDQAVHDNLWYVPRGVDRLRQYAGYKKPVWVWIETTDFNGNGTSNKPTPAQVKSEVWMALVHGALGIGYFAHVFAPSFIEAGLLADAAMKNAVAAINQQIHSLAPVLNTPSLADAVQVTSSASAVPVDFMAKLHGGALYVFAVAMRPGSTTATFTLNGKTGAGSTVEVIGESRSLSLSGGAFSDSFSDYGVHLYKIAP